ncbi:hypothetical protein A9Q84_13440 [Halobacteriovorax marinus]|uniref:SH3b domain-containing protein n=1 Tax=Halobacteriovorax marinus TaxID=97084 RepID=A0A1Y5FFD8_9BACT|nr:hypothetical protein A9Q84_13440 [Halobacteriovorax marinus]
MKDNINDMVRETIEETPLGGKSLAGILKDNSFDEPAKGLASLLSKEIGKPLNQTKQVTTDFYPTDTTIHNEFLRIEREKNEHLTESINTLLTLPEQMEQLQKKIDDISHFEEMKQLDQEISSEISKNNFSSLKEKRSFLYVVMAMCIVFGLIVGKVFFMEPEKEVIALKPLPKAIIVKKIKVLDQFVTTKFVNLRTTNSPKSSIVKTLSPNQIITQIEKKGGWIKVEFRDLINEKTVTGWAWYENLKELNKKNKAKTL